MLWARKPLPISGSLEDKYACGNLRVLKNIYIHIYAYVYIYMVLAHSYNLDLQISILELWTLSFPPSFLLFQALILCEELFSTSVHMYISFLHRRMSVDISYPSNLKLAFYQSQIFFFQF